MEPEAGNLAQCLRASTTLVESLSSLPSTHFRHLPAAYKLQRQGIWHAIVDSTGTCTHRQKHTQMDLIIKKINLRKVKPKANGK